MDHLPPGHQVNPFLPIFGIFCLSVFNVLHYVLLPCKLPVPTHVKKKKPQESSYLSIHTSKAFPFTKLQGHPILFSTPTGDHPFPPQSLPFCQPYFCQHRSPDKLEAQQSRRQHQPNSPAPEHGLWQEHSRGPAPGDAHLCSWAPRIIPLHRNYIGLHSSSPAPESPALRCRVWDAVQEF